jgi:hypothetical protein
MASFDAGKLPPKPLVTTPLSEPKPIEQKGVGSVPAPATQRPSSSYADPSPKPEALVADGARATTPHAVSGSLGFEAVANAQAAAPRPVPTAWMVKRGDQFVRLDQPPELGTPVYHGKFSKEIIDGGYDSRGEKNVDTVKWTPVGEAHAEPYAGAGDPNMVTFAPPDSPDAKTFMVKRGSNFVELTSPPPPGTEVFVGTFQKRVIAGGRDAREELSGDTIKWIPGADVRAQKFAGAVTEEF